MDMCSALRGGKFKFGLEKKIVGTKKTAVSDKMYENVFPKIECMLIQTCF